MKPSWYQNNEVLIRRIRFICDGDNPQRFEPQHELQCPPTIQTMIDLYCLVNRIDSFRVNGKEYHLTF